MYVPALIGGLGPWELGIILLLVLILFGAGKLPQVFESFGVAVKTGRSTSSSGCGRSVHDAWNRPEIRVGHVRKRCLNRAVARPDAEPLVDAGHRPDAQRR